MFVKRHYILIFILLFCSCHVSAQNFRFIGGATSQTFSFKLINNLIIIPVEVNGSKLSFILDSGVSAPVVFNLTSSDTLQLINVEKIQIRGLGTGEPIEALHSKNNRFRMGNLFAVNKSLFIIYKEQFDLSAKLGITVHGMIGYDLLKDFVVTINYVSKKITFTKPENYKYKRCSKCETFELEFYKKKPYINGEIVAMNSYTKIPVKLLIDSGGSDALWLFEDDTFAVPEKTFEDFIGEGITGSIYGMRSKLKSFSLKSFVFENPNVAYLDSLSTYHAKRFEERNGSLGGEILKRFKVVFDYPNKKITLKKNGMFNDEFGYNMSGIELMYSGKELVIKKGKAAFVVSNNQESITTNTFYLDVNYDYEFQPIYKIAHVRMESPAANAGILKGDVLVKLNGFFAYNYSIEDIIEKFYGDSGKKIRLRINRNGEVIDLEFRLKDLLE
ncbi:MAG: aspartyl protease family protein [Flavobacteriaceae bacterium]